MVSLTTVLKTLDEARRNESNVFVWGSGLIGNDHGARWEVTSAIERELPTPRPQTGIGLLGTGPQSRR